MTAEELGATAQFVEHANLAATVVVPVVAPAQPVVSHWHEAAEAPEAACLAWPDRLANMSLCPQPCCNAVAHVAAITDSMQWEDLSSPPPIGLADSGVYPSLAAPDQHEGGIQPQSSTPIQQHSGAHLVVGSARVEAAGGHARVGHQFQAVLQPFRAEDLWVDANLSDEDSQVSGFQATGTVADGVQGVVLDDPDGASASLPSRGSIGHATGTCRPCMFMRRLRGCIMGVNCNFCHGDHEGLTYGEVRRTMRAESSRNSQQRRSNQAASSASASSSQGVHSGRSSANEGGALRGRPPQRHQHVHSQGKGGRGRAAPGGAPARRGRGRGGRGYPPRPP